MRGCWAHSRHISAATSGTGISLLRLYQVLFTDCYRTHAVTFMDACYRGAPPEQGISAKRHSIIVSSRSKGGGATMQQISSPSTAQMGVPSRDMCILTLYGDVAVWSLRKGFTPLCTA